MNSIDVLLYPPPLILRPPCHQSIARFLLRFLRNWRPCNSRSKSYRQKSALVIVRLLWTLWLTS